MATDFRHVENFGYVAGVVSMEEEGAHKWTDELSRNLDKLLVCAEKIRTGLKLVLAKEE